MTISNIEAFELQNSINQILAENITLSAKVSYKLLWDLRKLNEVCALIDEVRKQVFDKYAQGNAQVPNELIESANKELQEVGQIQQDLDLLTIGIDDINQNLPIQIINGLMPIIDSLG